ncbi:MAG: IS21 family transposase [Sedimentisphaerales bacterium]
MRDELLENNVVSLHGRGWSVRRLSREFGISRGRVRRILGQNGLDREKGQENLKKTVKQSSKLDRWKDYIDELLEQYQSPPITNQRVFELLTEKGYEGKITILRDYLVEVRGKKTQEPIVCVETPPGVRASHDWSEYTIDFTHQESEKITFLSLILNYSRRQYIEVVEDKSQATLLRGLINAFIYFDGVPKEIKSDNQKACVDRWELGQPIFNRNFLNFATHYRFRPLAIHPGKPRENLKVERPFYYLETNFLNGRQFHDKPDLKTQLQRWLTEHNDRRIHRTTRRKPIELYEEELAFLQPLPARQYDTSVIAYRVVNNESAIQWEDYYYMVPAQYMYETCPVRVNADEIIIYSPDCRQIVSYRLAEKGRKDRYIGRKGQRVKYSLDAGEVALRLNAFGPIMQEYTLQLKNHKPGTYLHHWRRLLSLKVNYRCDDIITAVRRALKYHVFESQAIENFLQVNAQKQSEIVFPSKTSLHDE